MTRLEMQTAIENPQAQQLDDYEAQEIFHALFTDRGAILQRRLLLQSRTRPNTATWYMPTTGWWT